VINVKDDRNGGFYDLKKIGLFKKVQKAQFFAANAPPGGGRCVLLSTFAAWDGVSSTFWVDICVNPEAFSCRSNVTPRLMRHFHLLNIPDLAVSTMQRIFSSIMQVLHSLCPCCEIIESDY
jgi:hypothetical protein